MKKRNKKIKLWIISILLVPVTICATSVAIIFTGNKLKNSNYKNLFSTFDNITDNLISFGFMPDYHTNPIKGINHASYLNKYVNNNICKYVNDIVIKNGVEVNREQVNALHANTIILNENMKGLSPKFENIVNNISYSSRGDSLDARYSKSMVEGGYDWKTQNSVNNALMIQAKGLDDIYLGYNGYFEKEANNIIKKNIERINYLNINNISKIDNMTIGIIYSNTVDKTKVDQEFYICSPYVYPMLYSDDSEKGIGMEFPKPKESSFINKTHGYYDTSWRIQASSGLELIDQFKGKFDYLVYCAPDTSKLTKNDVINSNIIDMLTSKNLIDSNLIFSNIGEWYTPAWANIGYNYILDNVVKILNLNDLDDTKKWSPIPSEKLQRLREI